MYTGVQHDFYITRCLCHSVVTRRGVTSGVGTANPSGAHEYTPQFCVVRDAKMLFFFVVFYR